MAGDRALRLHRPARRRRLLSLTPLVDVMLILLVFFMVTSSYLNLEMVPMAGRSAEAAAAGHGDGAAPGGTLLIRVTADGRAVVRGRSHGADALSAAVAAALAARPDLRVLVLPSARARLQALVDVVEAAKRGGAPGVGIVRAEDG